MRGSDGRVRTFAPDEVRFAPLRTWRSPRTGVDYPVAMTLRAGAVDVDARAADRRSGARCAREHRHDLLGGRGPRVRRPGGERGRGYLELTGYGTPLRL